MQNPQSPVPSPQSNRPRAVDSELGIPKLADFGLAKQLDKSLRLTQTGIAVGTPHYMSPEQARGQADQIGPSADIHALGAILYELLVGYPPFGGGTPMETMQQVVDKKPVPPSQLRSGMPSDLEAICLMCLEKSPVKRYRTAEALADDLKAFLASRGPRQADDPSITVQAVERNKRSRIPSLITGLVLLALVAGATWFLTSRANRAALDDARRAERRAQLEAAIASCERGQVAQGLDQLRAIESAATADGLPAREIIDAWEGRLLQPTATHANVVADVLAMSPKGDLLAAAEGDTIRVGKASDWDAPVVKWTIDDPVAALGWSESGVDLAIATTAGEVLIGNVETGMIKPEPVVSRPDRNILAVGFSFPGVRIVYGGDTLTQEFAPSLQPRRAGEPNRFDLTGGPFAAAAIAPFTGDVAAVLANGALRIYDAADGRWRDLPPDGHASAVAYSPHGNVLVVGTRAGSVQLWDAVARVRLTDSVTLAKPVAAVAVGLSETKYLVAACPAPGADRAAGATWESSHPFVAPPIRLANRPGREVLGVAFSPDGTSLFVTSPHGVSRWRVRDAKRYGPVRDFTSSERFGQPASQEARFSAGTVDRAGRSLLVGGSGGRTFLIDADAGHTVKDHPGGRDMHEVTAVAAGPDGRTASVTKSGVSRAVARHWERGMEGDPHAHEFPCDINHETYLPDGSAVVLGCSDGKVRIWEPTGDRVRAELDCKSDVLAVAVSLDGTRLLAGCADGSAQLWDLEAAKELLTVRHRAEVRHRGLSQQQPGHREWRRHRAALARSDRIADRPATRPRRRDYGPGGLGRPDRHRRPRPIRTRMANAVTIPHHPSPSSVSFAFTSLYRSTTRASSPSATVAMSPSGAIARSMTRFPPCGCQRNNKAFASRSHSST